MKTEIEVKMTRVPQTTNEKMADIDCGLRHHYLLKLPIANVSKSLVVAIICIQDTLSLRARAWPSGPQAECAREQRYLEYNTIIRVVC